MASRRVVGSWERARVWVAVVCMGFAALGALAGNVSADDQRGVLPDGRAFRTDAEGNVLVDYIAELEVNIETLTSKVHSLEDELKVKERRLSAFEQGRTEAPIVEQDLFAPSGSSGKPQGKVLAEGKLGSGSAVQCPPVRCPACPPAAAPQKCPPPPPPVRCPAASDCEDQVEQCEDRLEKAQDQIEELGDRHQDALAALKGQLEDAREELSERKESLADSGTEIARLKEQLAAAEKSREALKIQTAGLQRQLEEAQSQNFAARERAEAQRAAGGRGVVYEPSVGQGQNSAVADELGRARQMAISSVKGRLRTSLNELNGQVSKRDRLFKDYAKNSRNVSVKPRPVVASSGLTLAQARVKIEKVNTMKDLAELQRDVASMRAVVQEDIALIERVR